MQSSFRSGNPLPHQIVTLTSRYAGVAARYGVIGLFLVFWISERPSNLYSYFPITGKRYRKNNE